MEKSNKKTKEKFEIECAENIDKTNNVLKAIFGILAFVLVVVSCFGAGYFGMQLGNKIDKKENSKEEQVEKLTIDSQVVKDLYEVFREDKDCESCVYWDEYSASQIKKYIAYKALDEKDLIEIRCGDLDDSYVNGYSCAFPDEAIEHYGQDNETKFEEAIKDEKTVGVSESVLEKKYKELFGKDAIMENEDFSIGYGPIAYYDKVNKLYVEFSCQCGGECAGVTQTLDSISQDGKKLVLNTTIVENIDSITKYYVFYTFEFEEETGNYIFVNREKKIDSTSGLIARIAELKDNFNLLLSGFECESEEYKFSETGDSILYKVKYQDSVKDLINDTFVNAGVASNFVPFYEKNSVFYSLDGSGGFLGSGYYIFEYDVVSEKSDTAVAEIKYIECYDDDVHDKIDSCQNNSWDKVSTMKFELKKVNDKWLIEKMESDMIAPVVR